MQDSDAGMRDGSSRKRKHEGTASQNAADSAPDPLHTPAADNGEQTPNEEDSDLENEDDSHRTRSRGSVSRRAGDYD